MSDDELLLLDFLAMNGGVPVASLHGENYSIHMNTPYSHNINQQNLPHVLANMQKRGIVRSFEWFCPRTQKSKLAYEITDIGGSLWESERNPVWQKFCSDSHIFGDTWELLSFRCVDPEIGRKFAEISLQAQLYNFPLKELKLSLALSDEPDSLLTWKTFPQEFVWTVRPYPDSDEYLETDWALYHQNRCWWRDLDELQLFLS